MNLTVRQYEVLLAATVRALEESERRYELLRGAHEALTSTIVTLLDTLEMSCSGARTRRERKGVQG